MKHLKLYLLALALGLPGVSIASDIGATTRECDGCHGVQGASSHDDVPIIGGQSADYITKSLESFQKWNRPCVKSTYRSGDTSRPKTDMCKIAGALSAPEITALGEHYAGLPFVAANQQFDTVKAEVGAGLHEQHCEICHERGGLVAARGPRLAGQWVPYLRATLKYVPTGEHMVPNMMERSLGKFSNEEIDALMDFYASQQE
jgi:sulfide dehydrogenase cytochrome subunit